MKEIRRYVQWYTGYMEYSSGRFVVKGQCKAGVLATLSSTEG